MKTILVVDDLPASRRLLAAFLRDDYRILEAADGRECIETAERERPDLVLLDLGLPGLDGITVIERIRRSPAIDATPIFALTAHTLKEYEEKAREAGCDEYIVKPFGLDDLRTLIRRTLSGCRAPHRANGNHKGGEA